MRPRTACLSLAMIAAVVATNAFADDAEREKRQSSSMPAAATASASGMPMKPMMGVSGGMMGGMPMGMTQMMLGQNCMPGHLEGRIAFIREELKISDAQQPLWNVVADAMRATANQMGMPNCMGMTSASGTLPEKLAARERVMTEHLEGLRKLKVAIDPLYALLDSEQKKMADSLIIGPMAIMGMGMI